MTRRRSTPWIHRWSRPLMGAIALVGAIGTAYLTVVKLTGGAATCPTEGCERVLTSAYATVLGLPLTLFGFLGYASMGIMAVAPLLINPTTQKPLRTRLENWTWPLLFIGATAMAVFSGYLMYVLALKLQIPCLYCIGSAILTLSLFVLAVVGREWEDGGQLIFRGLIVATVVLVGTLGIYANVDKTTASTNPDQVSLSPTTQPTPGIGWEITTTSGEAEIQLAQHLTKIGAKEYVAWWCPHCHEQKQLFGKEAYSQINYIECAPDGRNPRPDLCKAANIEGFPTWEINGQKYSGAQSLEKLAEVSGYQGPRNFKIQYKSPQG